MRRPVVKAIGVFLIFTSSLIINCFTNQGFGKEIKRPLKIGLNESGSRYISFSTYLQLWARYTETNPGTLIHGKPVDNVADISIRKFRFKTIVAPYENTIFVLQMGFSNVNSFADQIPTLQLLDAYVEYKFGDYLYIGGGRNNWSGLSRYSQAAGSSSMANDLAIISIPTVNKTDEFTRIMSLYAKGTIGKFFYAGVVGRPYSAADRNPDAYEPIENRTDFAVQSKSWQSSGYLSYQIFDKEANSSAAVAATYLGKKKLLNIGVGFKHQPNALWMLQQGDTVYKDMNLFATDVFMELPLRSGKYAINFYGAYFDYDFGPNYVRIVGVNNPSDGSDPFFTSFDGKGNGYPTVGTGKTLLFEGGVLTPVFFSKNEKHKLMPYARVQSSNFEILDDQMLAYDLGVNLFLDGHYSKFTLNYESRPIYNRQGDEIVVTDRKGMVILKYQIKF